MNAWTPPPAEPACAREEPTIFDVEFTFPMALAICATCPVRSWCLNTVDPARNYYDGVVGGHAWHDGKPMLRYSDTTDPALQLYLKNRRRNLKRHDWDRRKVDDFLVGKIQLQALNNHEKLMSAYRLKEIGAPIELNRKRTHLDIEQLQDIYQNAEKYRREYHQQ